MNQPSCSLSLDLDTCSNSSDSLSECETLTVPDPNDPVTVQKFVEETVVGPISLQKQNVDRISAINSQLHIGDVHKNFFHFHGNIKPPTKEETQENGGNEPNSHHSSDQVQAIPDSGSTPQNVLKRLKFFLMERSMVFWLAGLVLAILSITSLTLFFCFHNFEPTKTALPVFGHNDNLGDDIQVIHRAEWSARPPLNFTKLDHPLKMVRIMHTGGSYCTDYQSCVNKVLALQGWQVGTQNMDDISYNFLIGGDGNVYEGRGAEVENQWKKDAYDIVYIGNYLKPYDKVTDKMDLAGRSLLKKLEDEGHLTSDYIVVAQNQTHNTQSPGDNVYSRVIKWPHYDSGLYFKN